MEVTQDKVTEAKQAIREIPTPPTPPKGPSIADFQALQASIDRIAEAQKQADMKTAMKDALGAPPPGLNELKQEMGRALSSLQNKIEAIEYNDRVAAHHDEQHTRKLQEMLVTSSDML